MGNPGTHPVSLSDCVVYKCPRAWAQQATSISAGGFPLKTLHHVRHARLHYASQSADGGKWLAKYTRSGAQACASPIFFPECVCVKSKFE